MAPWGNKRVRRALPALVLACALTLGLSTAVADGPPAAPVTVSVYPNADCSGPPYPSASAASLASPGIGVQVQDDSQTTLSATATDTMASVSACSAPRAIDAAGNVDPTPASRVVVVRR
jgi:hypothetical protein